MNQGKLRIFVVAADSLSGLSICRNITRGTHSRNKFESVTAGVFDMNSQNTGKLREFGCHVVDLKDLENKDELKQLFQNQDVVCCVPDPSACKKQEESVDNLVHKTRMVFEVAAEASAVKSLVLISAMGADRSDSKTLSAYHVIEKNLMELKSKFEGGVAILRTGFYQQHFLWFAEQIQKKALKLPIEENKKWATIDVNDVGSFTAIILTAGDRNSPIKEHKDKTYCLTGCEARNGKQVAEIMTNAIFGGEQKDTIRFEKVDRQEVCQYLSHRPGMKKLLLEVLLDYFTLIEQGKLDDVSHDFKKITDSEPKKIEQFFKDNAQSFK